jgi:transposase-like protein
MSKQLQRSFSLEFKLVALGRMERGETIASLSAAFGVHRQLLYKWRDAQRAGRLGRRRGWPTKAQVLARETSIREVGELEAARRRVAELERKAALDMALADRRPPLGELVHHSDRGVQYACGDYARRLEEARVIPSTSRGGCPHDNAKAESFMKTLKQEEVDGSTYRDLTHARSCIGGFIEDVYNRTRPHSALDYRSPMEFENDQPGPWTAIPQPTDPTTTVPH